MYIFNVKDEKKVEVWEFTPRMDEIREYKISEMSSIKEDEKLLTHKVHSRGKRLNSTHASVTCPQEDPNKQIEGLGCLDTFVYGKVDENYEEYYQAFLNSDSSLLKKGKLFHIIGVDGRQVPVSDTYLFGIGGYESRYHDANLSGLINMPRSVYILTCLEMGRFDLVKGLDSSEQLDLFDTTFVKEIDVNNLPEMVKYGLIPEDALEHTKKKLSDSKYVMSLKKKK